MILKVGKVGLDAPEVAENDLFQFAIVEPV
jgi:hypothetical protein